MQTYRRIIGYARVSSAEQAIGSSLQDQQDVIEAYAKARGLKVTKMYVESQSAIHEKFEKRDQMIALMADVRSGDLVLCDKIDRWSRDPSFTYDSVRTILKSGASFYAIRDACDPSTSEGDTALGFRILFAREEHKRIKERTVGTRRLLRDHGYFTEGVPPWGYKRQSVKGRERNVLLIDEEIRPKIVRAFALCIAGRSIGEIAETLGENRNRVYLALNNVIYLGEIENTKGENIPGKHAPIIDAETFAQAQEALASRRHGSRPPTEGARTSTWWLREIARCLLCGARASAVYGSSPRSPRGYYACAKRCTRRIARVDVVEPMAHLMVLARLGELRDELASTADAKASPATDPKALADRIAKLEKKRARYVEAFSDGAMTREDLRMATARVDAEIARLNVKTPKPAVTGAQKRAALKDVTAIAEAWRKANPKVRRVVVRAIARSVGIANGHAPKFEWKTSEEIARGKA